MKFVTKIMNARINDRTHENLRNFVIYVKIVIVPFFGFGFAFSCIYRKCENQPFSQHCEGIACLILWDKRGEKVKLCTVFRCVAMLHMTTSDVENERV